MQTNIEQLSEDPVDVSDISEHALTRMAGNGMSLACCGFVWLMTILCVEDSC